jgi:hypothetical protein
MPFANLTDSFAVAMDQWSTQHYAFIVETFFKIGNSLVKTWRIFHRHLNPAHHRSHNTM